MDLRTYSVDEMERVPTARPVVVTLSVSKTVLLVVLIVVVLVAFGFGLGLAIDELPASPHP